MTKTRQEVKANQKAWEEIARVYHRLLCLDLRAAIAAPTRCVRQAEHVAQGPTRRASAPVFQLLLNQRQHFLGM
jgi:hypothetical protein